MIIEIDHSQGCYHGAMLRAESSFPVPSAFAQFNEKLRNHLRDSDFTT